MLSVVDGSVVESESLSEPALVVTPVVDPVDVVDVVDVVDPVVVSLVDVSVSVSEPPPASSPLQPTIPTVDTSASKLARRVFEFR